jgi:hypothetical protein
VPHYFDRALYTGRRFEHFQNNFESTAVVLNFETVRGRFVKQMKARESEEIVNLL